MSKLLDKNKFKSMLSDLESLGLSNRESEVYLSLLQLGEVGASKIVSATGLHGQTVYNALDTLEQKNLCRFNIVKGRKRFVAQGPDNLILMVEQKKTVAQQISNNISKSFSFVDSLDIEVYHGKEAFIQNEFNRIKELPKGSELLVIGGSGDTFIKSFAQNMTEYEFQRNKKDIKVRYIGANGQKDYLEKSKYQRKGFDYRTLPSVFSGVTNITIFPNNAIIFYLFDENIDTIIIQQKKIVESYVDFFESLWNLGAK